MKGGAEAIILVSISLYALIKNKGMNDWRCVMRKLQTEKIEETEVRLKLIDICNDQAYYMVDSDTKTRTYVMCPNCGFIPISKIDDNTKFIDLHCKCSNFAIYVTFTDEEILEMIENSYIISEITKHDK